MRNRNRVRPKMKLEWIIVFAGLIWATKSDATDSAHGRSFSEIDGATTPTFERRDGRGLVQPRMNYEEWTPLGHGDPLKNDPTYDYVPPVLDRVHYWIDSPSRKSSQQAHDAKKTEILVLGVSSKKPSTASLLSTADSRRDNNYEYLKYKEFAAQGNYNNPHQRIQRPHSQTQYFPSPAYFKGNSGGKQPDHVTFPGKPEQRVPYTVLVPPPMFATHIPSTSTTAPPSELGPLFSTSTASADWKDTIQSQPLVQELPTTKANVSFNSVPTSYSEHTANYSIVHRIPPKRPLLPLHPSRLVEETTLHGGKHDIRFPEHSPFKSAENGIIVVPSSGIGIEKPDKMHKGQVTDDTMDLASTYVNIGKPDAKVQSPSGVEIQSVPMLESPIMAMPQPPIPMQMNKRPSWLINNSQLEQFAAVKPHPMVSKPQDFKKPAFTPSQIDYSKMTSSMFIPPEMHLDTTKILQKTTTPILASLLRKEISATTTTTTTPSPSTTTTVASLTTDPLFKHYKQPMEPLKGPLYLIIQGHSKVKTYGPTKQIDGIPVQESNEIPSEENKYSVKHLHDYRNKYEEKIDKPGRGGRSADLQSLKHVVVTGLGAIDPSIITADSTEKQPSEVQETEFEVKYDVKPASEVTSEKYRKGIVESDELDRN